MKIHLEQEVSAFSHLYKEVEDVYHEIALSVGVSDGAFDVLYVLCVLGDGCLQRDICRETFVSKQTVNSSVRSLEKKGFLYLEKEGRDKHIYLTESGKRFADERIRPVIEAENEVFLAMKPDEKAEFLRLFRKLADGYQERKKPLLEKLR
ncbi:MAG TPA: MarR family transcriptional regulator [Candidatus Mediterraneibacter merdipullorum]|nr:MarR family transcriptional regulator [Candidatus Mediterraneibacter merdipullorum]